MKQFATKSGNNLFFKAFAVLSLLTLTLFTQARAQTQSFGYVWADQPTQTSYAPNLGYAYNAGNSFMVINRTSTGRYTVEWNGLSGIGVNGGHVQVSAYGAGNAYCKVGSWSAQLVNVQCYDQSGAAADALYTVLYLKPLAGTTGLAYAWANDPTSASYTPTTSYSYNPTGGATTITRSATGTYNVKWDGLGSIGLNGGNVLVTAYGGDSNRCKVSSWGTDSVNVLCYDVSGNLVDTRYTVLYTKPLAGSKGLAYAWGNDSGSASYTPNAIYSFNPTGLAIQASHSTTGRYTVRWDGLSSVGINGGHAQVTAYGPGADRCKIAFWGNDQVTIDCHDQTGNLADTRFSLLFLKPVALGVAVEDEVPVSSTLLSSYPNPMRDEGTILYQIEVPTRVRIDLYDLLGRHVRTLVDGSQVVPGTYRIPLQTEGLPAGLYMYRMQTNTELLTQTLIINP